MKKFSISQSLSIALPLLVIGLIPRAEAQGTVRLCVDTFESCPCPASCSETYCERICKALSVRPPCLSNCRPCSCGAFGKNGGCESTIVDVLLGAFVTPAFALEGAPEKGNTKQFVETPLGTVMVWDGVPADQVEDGTVGVKLGTVGDQLALTGIDKDSPAEKGGLLKGQIILSIDGRSTKGMPLGEAAKSLRGKAGTMVVLRVKSGILPWGKKVALVRIPRSAVEPDKPVDGMIVKRVPLKDTGAKACPAEWEGCHLVLAQETCHYVCKAD